jgi:hypothetical protein
MHVQRHYSASEDLRVPKYSRPSNIGLAAASALAVASVILALIFFALG